MKIKVTYLIGALVVVAVVLGGYIFYLQQQLAPTGQVVATGQTTGQTTQGQTASTYFEQYAKDLGLNVDQFTSCLNSGKYKSDIQNDLKDGQSYGVDGTPTFFINGKSLVGAQPFSAFQSMIDAELASPSTNSQIKTGSNPVRGSADAPVTIVEFSDFQCPYCARVEPTVEQVMQQYQGKVKLYFRDFPLSSIHPYAEQAAEASRCAGEQGKYWEYHDMLYQKQTEWAQ